MPNLKELRFQQDFPTNGAVWLNLLNRAEARNDEDGVDWALEQIGRANAVRFHWNSLLGNLALALHSKRSNSLPSLLNSLNPAMLSIFPEITPVNRACKEPLLSRAGRRALCQRAGLPLMETDTLFGDVMGVVIEKNSWAEGTSQRAQVDARIAWNRCRAIGQSELFERASATDASAEIFLHLLLTLPGERDVEDALRLHNSTSSPIDDSCGSIPAPPDTTQ